MCAWSATALDDIKSILFGGIAAEAARRRSRMSTTTSAEFEKATDYSFREDDIERAKALVGHYAPSSAREHLTEASHDAMRNFARSYGADNPLFNPDVSGESTRWRWEERRVGKEGVSTCRS